MSKDLKKLSKLEAELHEVNEELRSAARPLDQLEDLNEEQRDQVGVRLRAGIARWETVTQRIAEMLKNYKPDPNG
jgi:hypothetical protein